MKTNGSIYGRDKLHQLKKQLEFGKIPKRTAANIIFKYKKLFMRTHSCPK